MITPLTNADLKPHNYLYILPFNNDMHFKIGVSSNNYSRVIKHNSTYDINYSKSLIVQASRDNVRNLERILLSNIPTTVSNEYSGKDGYTEIRDISYLATCLDDINYFKSRLNLNITTLKEEDICPAHPKEFRRFLVPQKMSTEQKDLKLEEANKVHNIKAIKDCIILMRQVITEYPRFRISYDAKWQMYDLELDLNDDELQSQLIHTLLHDNMSVWLRKGCGGQSIGVTEMSIYSKGVKFARFAFSVNHTASIEFPVAWLPEELEAFEQLRSFMSRICGKQH
tara:strand:- start:862 stop:1710 length:849 start_codon:yes stop_codon:yes gene_type:complete